VLAEAVAAGSVLFDGASAAIQQVHSDEVGSGHQVVEWIWRLDNKMLAAQRWSTLLNEWGAIVLDHDLDNRARWHVVVHIDL